MTGAPDNAEEPPVKGGRAAERLREFLAARFGRDAPPIPPDEEKAEAEAAVEPEAEAAVEPEADATDEPRDDAAARDS